MKREWEFVCFLFSTLNLGRLNSVLLEGYITLIVRYSANVLSFMFVYKAVLKTCHLNLQSSSNAMKHWANIQKIDGQSN